MPITKTLKIYAVITRFMLHTLDKWRTLGRTNWNQLMSRDAAHLALPFVGEGANLVMYDGAELSKSIAASLGDTEATLLACKRNLFLPAHLLLWRRIGSSSCVSATTRLKVNLTCSPITSPSNNCFTKREKSA